MPFQISLKIMLGITGSLCIVLASFNLSSGFGILLAIIFWGSWWIYLGSNDSKAYLKKYHGVAFLCGLLWPLGLCLPFSELTHFSLFQVMTSENNAVIAIALSSPCIASLFTAFVLRRWIGNLNLPISLLGCLFGVLLCTYLFLVTLALTFPGEWYPPKRFSDWINSENIREAFSLPFNEFRVVIEISYQYIPVVIGVIFILRWFAVKITKHSTPAMPEEHAQ